MHADPSSRSAASRPPRALAIAPVIVAAIALVAAGYWWLGREPSPPAAVVPGGAPAAPAPPEPTAAPAIQHPIENAQADVAAEPLAPDAESGDAVVYARLAQALAGTPFERVVVREDFVRKFVATVDNLPRRNVAVRLRPVQPAPGPLVAESDGQRATIGAANASRYADLMRLVDAADPRALVAVYVRNYPLFQQAYRELGYPNGYFNDRLVVAIDSLLATPEIDGAIALAQPRVLYEYADPTLEGLPAGQKALLRLGRENGARVKGKLREIRALVATGGPR